VQELAEIIADHRKKLIQLERAIQKRKDDEEQLITKATQLQTTFSISSISNVN
jgi:hypothetical protein